MRSAIEISGLAVERDGCLLLDGVDMRLDAGDVLAVMGPSGSGKTTLLRVIAGLETPTRGGVMLDGETASIGKRICIPPEERRIAMIFQDLGLWPHMSVAQHLAFALWAQRVRKDEWPTRIDSMLESVGLGPRRSSRPATLSGGERQRLAIARALITQPRIVLFDEPLASIDVVLKDEPLALFRTLLRAGAATAVCVTHDLSEAMAFTQDIAVLEHGRVVQRGQLASLRQSPASPFVQKLLTHEGESAPL